jgi:hypothetical protein
MSLLQRPRAQRGGGNLLASLIALVTTLCCLGFPALVGLFATLGAGFLVSDRYLEPMLLGSLLLTIMIVGLHLRRHHQPGPFILSLVAAGSVFFAIYGVGWLPHASGSDHMADGMVALPTWSPSLAYGAILVLLLGQVWDLWLYRRCAPKTVLVPTSSAAVFSDTRKKGV